MSTEVRSQDVSSRTPEVRFSPRRVPEFRNGIIVRMPNHLGDAIMALPALMSLRTILPEHCGLFVIAPASAASLYRAVPEVDAVVILKHPHHFYSAAERREIRQLRPGAAVLFNHSFRDAVSLRLAGVKSLYGEPTRCRGWLLTAGFPFPREKGRASSHQAMRYLAIAEALGGKRPASLTPRLVPPCPADELPDAIRDLLRHPLLLTLAPGAAYGAAKRWPQEYFAAVGKYWIRRGGIIALVGSPNECGICAAVAAGMPRRKCFNLCGRTELPELMQLFRFSALALTNDSGLMHLAAALDKVGLTVFGPTDPGDTGPLSTKWKILYSGEPCSPCLRRVCPKGSAVCMKTITPAQVIRALVKTARELRLPLGKYFRR